jgi:hypothetical protein
MSNVYVRAVVQSSWQPSRNTIIIGWVCKRSVAHPAAGRGGVIGGLAGVEVRGGASSNISLPRVDGSGGEGVGRVRQLFEGGGASSRRCRLVTSGSDTSEVALTRSLCTQLVLHVHYTRHAGQKSNSRWLCQDLFVHGAS